MPSSDSALIALLVDIPKYLHRYVVPILFVLGNLGNVISIAIFSKRSWRKNVCTFYFVICLLCSTVYLNATMLGSIAIMGFNIHAHNSNPMLCKLFYFISYLVSTYYPIILILASVDRLLISSQKVDTRLYSSKRLAYFSIGTSSIVWSIFSLHVLIKVSIQEIYPSVSICYYELSKSYLTFFLYSTLALSIIVPLVMVVLSIFAFKNVRRIRAVPRQQRNEIRSMTKKDFQLLRCLYVHDVVYVVFTSALSASVIYSTTKRYDNRTPMQEAIDSFLSNMGIFLHHIPYCTSFLIDISISKAFRCELRRCARPSFGNANPHQNAVRDTEEIPDVVLQTIAPSA